MTIPHRPPVRADLRSVTRTADGGCVELCAGAPLMLATDADFITPGWMIELAAQAIGFLFSEDNPPAPAPSPAANWRLLEIINWTWHAAAPSTAPITCTITVSHQLDQLLRCSVQMTDATKQTRWAEGSLSLSS